MLSLFCLFLSVLVLIFKVRDLNKATKHSKPNHQTHPICLCYRDASNHVELWRRGVLFEAIRHIIEMKKTEIYYHLFKYILYKLFAYFDKIFKIILRSFYIDNCDYVTASISSLKWLFFFFDWSRVKKVWCVIFTCQIMKWAEKSHSLTYHLKV